jgi:heme-degrading monooxygenase HmoA
MFIAMNRFKVALGKEAEFEAVWKNRESHLHKRPGFLGFLVLRGPTRDDHTLFSSHTTWASRADFDAWTVSEEFAAAHRNAHKSSGLMIGPNQFEGFDVVLALPAPTEADRTGAAA